MKPKNNLSTKLLAMVKRHEGFSARAYFDNAKNAKASNAQFSIGWGTRAKHPGEIIGRQEGHVRLIRELREARTELRWMMHYSEMGRAREDALIDMVFNLGMDNFLGFNRMLSVIEHLAEWGEAAFHALDSKWRGQVGNRVWDIANMLRTGEYCERERNAIFVRDGIRKGA